MAGSVAQRSYRRAPGRLRRAALLLAWCVSPALAEGPPAPPSQPPATPALGINLAGPADWNTELPLCDVFRFAREWISQREGAPWGEGPTLELDRRGNVLRLAPGCFAETALCTIDDGRYPSGQYVVRYDGQGSVELSKGRTVEQRAGRLVVDLNAVGGGFFLRLKATDERDPVRNIRVFLPGAEETTARHPWRSGFLDRWRGMACLRFMDLQMTNNSTQRCWADRPQMDDAVWTRAGLPIEALCDLANRLEADAWFCMPHAADDDYVRQFARLVRERLDRRRRAYIEYSNEVWNSQFEQYRYAAAQGRRLALADEEWVAAWRFTARRSVEIFRLWEEEFGSRDRFVRVLASQAGNAYVAEQIVGWDDAYRHADVLAIAPYVSLNLPADGDGLTAGEAAGWSVEQLLNHVEEHSLPEAVDWMEANARVARAHGLQLVCYEAGQHLVGVAGGENNERLTKLLHAANADPRMGGVYARYYRAWEEAGGGLLCHFSSTSRWSKWGSWGLLQFYDEDPAQSPKAKATFEWAQRLGQR